MGHTPARHALAAVAKIYFLYHTSQLLLTLQISLNRSGVAGQLVALICVITIGSTALPVSSLLTGIVCLPQTTNKALPLWSCCHQWWWQ